MTAAATQPLHEGVFRQRPDGSIVLIGGYSPSSGRTHFPRLPACPYTGADDVEEVELPTGGTLWGWTGVTARPPGYDGEMPFGFDAADDGFDHRLRRRIVEDRLDAAIDLEGRFLRLSHLLTQPEALPLRQHEGERPLLALVLVLDRDSAHASGHRAPLVHLRGRIGSAELGGSKEPPLRSQSWIRRCQL